MELIKVKPWGEGQGDHVLINADDFNPKAHKRLDDVDDDDNNKVDDMTANEMRAVLTERGVAFKTSDNKAELKALLDASNPPE